MEPVNDNKSYDRLLYYGFKIQTISSLSLVQPTAVKVEIALIENHIGRGKLLRSNQDI